MHPFMQGARERWTVSAATALLVVPLVFALFHVPSTATPFAVNTIKPAVTFQSLDGSNVAFDEKTLLTDPTPLFLPTKWNATQKVVAGPDPKRAFTNYPPSFSGTSPEKILDPPVEVPATPLDALTAGSPTPPLYGFGRHDATLPTLPPRGAFLEIVEQATGRRVVSRALPEAYPPGEGTWQPMEFLVAVDASGVIATLEPTKPSGVPEVDRYFQRYLAQTLRVGQRLSPGIYRVSVGP